MRIFFPSLSILIAALASGPSFATDVVAPKGTPIPNEQIKGVELKLSFHDLEAGQNYRLHFTKETNTSFFTGWSEKAPEGIRFHENELEFRAAATTAQFSVGVALFAGSELAVELPGSASVEITVDVDAFHLQRTLHEKETLEIGHTVKPAAFVAQMRAAQAQRKDYHLPAAMLGAPVGCLAKPLCDNQGKCPTGHVPPVKCYGPLLSQFFCCSSDPNP
jgi:hypothetical protein